VAAAQLRKKVAVAGIAFFGDHRILSGAATDEFLTVTNFNDINGLPQTTNLGGIVCIALNPKPSLIRRPRMLDLPLL
jgi:hypothetical protein